MAEGGIDRKMEERMEFSTSKEVRVAPTFEAMHLKENLLRGIYAYGYESPSAVQSRAIVQICKGRDTIAQAQSGTGKTATFSISILQVIDTAVRETQGMLHTFALFARSCSDFPSSRPVSHSRIGNPDPVRRYGSRRLHERSVPRLYRWNQRWRRYSQARPRSTCRFWYSWTCRRYDPSPQPPHTQHQDARSG